MKKARIFLAGLACLALASCGTMGDGSGGVLGNIFGPAASGQSLGNILISVIGLDKPSQAELIGTWRYTQPGVAFTSENLLAKAGGEVAAAKIREELNTYYKQFGVSSSNTVIQFNQDNTFTAKILGKTISGNYTYDQQTCQITLKTLLFTMPAYTKRTVNGMSILFESKKLLTVLQTVAAISGNATLQTIGDLSTNYNGVRLGFDMKK
ncbi:MAG: DUF4923 family protein [Prevotella sp.]|jgi:hypothetical protein|nr:DUF4923 family protein [Prevotella sp.]